MSGVGWLDRDENDDVRLPIAVLAGIAEHLERIVSTIADLGTAVAANTQAVADLTAHLANQGTTLDAADQATVDGVVTALTANTAALEAIVSPPAPVA